MTISEFAALIQRRLRDDTGRQWTTEYVIDAINAAFSALCHVVPQAYTEHRNLMLKVGTEQRIDDDLHRIIHMLHNVCKESGDPKRSIIKADLSIMDKTAPHWRQDDPRGYIIHYLLNPIDESMFYVWPPAIEGDCIRGVFTKTPCVTLDATAELPVRGLRPFVPNEPIEPAPDADQATLDQYVIDLEEYNTALKALARWTALDPDYVAVAPTAPTNPGNLGDGAVEAEDGFFPDSGIGDFGRVTALVPRSDPRITSTSSGINFQTGSDIIDLVWPDLSQNSFYATPRNVNIQTLLKTIEDGPVPGGSNQDALVDGTGVNMVSDDPRLIAGSVVRLHFFGTSSVTYLGTDLYDPGVTQADIDMYLADLAEFNFDTLVYQCYLDIQQELMEFEAQSTSGEFTVDDELPFDKAHHLPLQEFSLYYALIRDDEQTGNAGRAQQHWQNFYQLLNKREDAELLVKAAEGDSE